MTTIRHHSPSPRRPATVLAVLLVALAVAGCGATVSADVERVDATASMASPELTPVATRSPAAVDADPTATPSAVAGASGLPSGSALPAAIATPEPPRKAFAMNLYRRGDYVAQYTFEWCVGASLQMALNMTTAQSDTSRAYQKELWEMAQARSSSPFGGANPRGWTAALNDLGIGPYVLVSIPTFDEALRVAATAIRETKRPVGLVMWRGRHAWVMSGFESDGDPAAHADVTVTGIRVLDPLYPHGSRAWGPSPRPNALVSPATLAEQYVIRDSGRVNLGVPPGYLLVLPTSAAPGEPAA
jgi:hypothetical protein